MKLRKFFGLTSRSVLEQVRAELGADAVIVANHATNEGVEVTALAGNAIDTLLAPEPRRESPPSQRPSIPQPPLAIAGDDDAPRFAAAIEPRTAGAAATDDPLAPALRAEVAAMRELIEERFAMLSFNDSLRRRPLATQLTRDLLAAGYSSALVRSITSRLPDDMSAGQVRNWVVGVLARNLRCVGGTDEIVTRGGVYALIGPTGVGKTTTTAKLAARCAVRYGANRLALITTDSFRIGAQDQLRIYAKILGVAVHTVSDRNDLRQALDAVSGRHLVLIDTVGMSQRDARVAEQAMLLAHPEIRRILLLNAAAQGETLEEVVGGYGRTPETIDTTAHSALAGCIVTKQDEAIKHGAALDVAIRHRLPLHYVTCGQRVPEDLFVPAATLMIERSLRAGAKPSPFSLSDDDMTLTVAGAAGLAHA